MSILSVSHNDLDGISAQIILRQFVGELTRMNVSYGKIDEYLEIINEYCQHHRPAQVWVTDLSFTFEQLNKLSNIAKMFPDIQFYFIDHHPFSEDYNQLKNKNFMILINQKASATKLTYLFCKNNIKQNNDKDLQNYVEYVNTYDLWIKDSPLFKGSLVYNELFWEFKKDYYFTRFKDEFKLRNADKDRYIEMMKKKKKLFDKLEKAGRIFRHEKRIFMIFLDDYKNHVTIDYSGFDSYIIVSSYGGVSIRLRDGLSDDGKLKDAIIKRVLEHENIETGGGHPKAFGTLIVDATAHKQVQFARELLKIIDEELDNL